MSVLETVTVDNVTYDMHDPKVGSGTLSTTAQTLIPAVNEVKSGLTTVSGKTDVIGSGSLNTTSQTLIGAVNELKAGIPAANLYTAISHPAYSGYQSANYTAFTPAKTGQALLIVADNHMVASRAKNQFKIKSGATVLTGDSYYYQSIGNVCALALVSVTNGTPIVFTIGDPQNEGTLYADTTHIALIYLC